MWKDWLLFKKLYMIKFIIIIIVNILILIFKFLVIEDVVYLLVIEFFYGFN